MRQKILTFLFYAIFIYALFCIISIPYLFFFNPPFKDKMILTLFFFIITIEKIRVAYFRSRKTVIAKVGKDWTLATVIGGYILFMYGTIIEFYLKQKGIIYPLLSIIGFIIYIAAVVLLYSALHSLGEQWAGNIDKGMRKQLITEGPYRYVRHPLYLSLCMEIIGISLIFNSFYSLLLGVCILMPLVVNRAYFEERFLKEGFGQAYIDYASRVWAFFPITFGKKSSKN